MLSETACRVESETGGNSAAIRQRRWPDGALGSQARTRRLARTPPPATAESTRRYFKEGREALAPGATWEAMHAFRLRTKRFRYTLETFRDFYGPGIEKRIEPRKSPDLSRGNQRLHCHDERCSKTSKVRRSASKLEGERPTTRQPSSGILGSKLSTSPEGAERLWTRYLVAYACRRLVAEQGRNNQNGLMRYIRYKTSLGGRLTVRLRPLEPRIGVRIPASQPT